MPRSSEPYAKDEKSINGLPNYTVEITEHIQVTCFPYLMAILTTGGSLRGFDGKQICCALLVCEYAVVYTVQFLLAPLSLAVEGQQDCETGRCDIQGPQRVCPGDCV